ncbi:MAG: hypothetical protein WCT37_04420 [Patescibacteria group bacterium]|jgi:tRNA G10  N-methylase Trm11
MLYYFILGQSPKLSSAEIYSVLKSRGLNFKIVKFSHEVFLAEISGKFDANDILDQLGGTIKIGEIIAKDDMAKIKPDLISQLLLQSGVRSPKSGETQSLLAKSSLGAVDSGLGTKFHFGFSTYRLGATSFRLPRNFGLEVKKLLKEKGVPSRLVVSKEPNLSSVTVAKNRLLKNGAEICLLADGAEIYLGKTLAVQRFGEYSKFDYGRPGRDAESGMLPPKVAKIMINLGESKVRSPESGENSPRSSSALLDPFCGSGTILQEASRLGYTNLIGSDISPKAIADTEANFNFLNQADSHIPHTTYHIPQLYTLDAKELSAKIKPQSVDTIITEPFLGPALRGGEKPEKIKALVAELSALYLKSLAEFKKVLRPAGRVVIIFPVLQGQPSISNQQLSAIKQLGFAPAWNLPIELQPLLTPRGSIIYSRAGQQTEREIFVFQV